MKRQKDKQTNPYRSFGYNKVCAPEPEKRSPLKATKTVTSGDLRVRGSK